MSHPRNRVDGIIHQPVRFSIIALLAAVERAEFGFVRDRVEISDSLLSRSVATLEHAGYVRVEKGYVGKHPRTWLALTPEGRAAFDAHVAALRAIIAAGDTPVHEPSRATAERR